MLDTDAGLEQALETAYRFLNQRERTQAEMRAHLDGKGIGSRDVERTIGGLVEQGQLDDSRFARLFVEDRRGLDDWGSDRIRHALLARGVDPDIIDEALTAHEQVAGSELDRALALLRRRFPSPPRDRKERDRALGVLIRKGFEPELALDAIAAHANDADFD